VRKLLIICISCLSFISANGNEDIKPWQKQVKEIIKEGKLIVYQNGCDFLKASGKRRNECMEYPRRKNGKRRISSTGVFFNLPKKYNSFDFPICTYTHVDFGYKADDIVIHLQDKNGKYNQSKNFYTKPGLKEEDYKNFTAYDKEGKFIFTSGSLQFNCTWVYDLLEKPRHSGTYEFYFTFRGKKSNLVSIELTLDKSSHDGPSFIE